MQFYVLHIFASYCRLLLVFTSLFSTDLAKIFLPLQKPKPAPKYYELYKGGYSEVHVR